MNFILLHPLAFYGIKTSAKSPTNENATDKTSFLEGFWRVMYAITVDTN